ncbi:Arc family DNA-binding protein [Aminobacter sp. UC22_36]|uniref:Arc family DNA-binding protein n=1 Tax=Aminobacter sp. UC22_36 TaxID=3374549 RepID=UPI0037563B19
MATEPIQPQDKYVVRFPDGMRDSLKQASWNNNRSLNAEIIARLDEHPELVRMARQLEGALARKDQEIDGLKQQVELLQAQVESLNRSWDLQTRLLDLLETVIKEAGGGNDARLKKFMNAFKQVPPVD